MTVEHALAGLLTNKLEAYSTRIDRSMKISLHTATNCAECNTKRKIVAARDEIKML
jgi:hypothetical protein